MVNIIFYIVILISGISIGYLGARKYENRVIHLDDIILILKTVQSEMEYRRDPLPVLLEQIGERTDNSAGTFLLSVSNHLRDLRRFNLSESWEHAVLEVYGNTALKEEDKTILSQAGIQLGKTDIENQDFLLNHVVAGLNRQRIEADEERRTKGKVYRTLGIASGLLAIIILL